MRQLVGLPAENIPLKGVLSCPSFLTYSCVMRVYRIPDSATQGTDCGSGRNRPDPVAPSPAAANRVKSVLGGVTTYDVGNYVEWTGSTSTMIKYYYAGSQRVAMRQGSSTLYYLLGDHLGSTAKTYNAVTGATTELRYHPWGGTRYTSGTTPTTRRYTGQIDDYYIKLYHMGARMYDPELGRFISADSIIPNPADPQSLNRYSYCLNNPLKYIDPNGHEPISVIIVIGIALFKAADYGWTAYDMWQSGRVLSNPNASRGDKLLAGLNIGLGALLEAAEPDGLKCTHKTGHKSGIYTTLATALRTASNP